jgi:sulfate transport system ATP-binding protein
VDIVKVKNGRPCVVAKVTHVNPTRPVVKVRVYSEAFGVMLNVDLSWDRFEELALALGDTVYVTPRQMRVFVQDYVI